MSRLDTRTYKILIVDDSEDDRFLLEHGLQDHPSCEVVAYASDGEMAIEYLRGGGRFVDRERYRLPDCICLDLNMPQVDGFEVLEWLQKEGVDPLLVIVVSNSLVEKDVERARMLGGKHYLVKGQPDLTA